MVERKSIAQEGPKLKVAILVFPGVEELDFVGFLEALAVANRIADRKHFEYELVGTEDGPIVCSGGLRVLPDKLLEELGDPELLFIPGGGVSRQTGVDRIRKDAHVLEVLRRRHAAGKKVWSVCTGALVLGDAGLLRGKRATTHHEDVGELESAGARVERHRTVVDGAVATGGGISSSIDMGLMLVAAELGKTFSELVREKMEYYSPPEV